MSFPTLLLVTLIAATPVFSQAIAGTVTDERGAPLSGLQVLLTSSPTISAATLQTVTTDTQGRYTFTGLPTTPHGLAVQRGGFDIIRRVPAPVVAGKTTTVNLTVAARILPQFVVGGGWSTSIVISEVTDQGNLCRPALEFYNDNGTPLGVSLSPADTPDTVKDPIISPGGTTVYRFESTGPLQQGWVRIYVPDGVTAYAVFRHSVPGRADQEAVVPVSSNLSTASVLAFDNRNLTTAAAILNPSDTPVNVTATFRNGPGQATATSTISLPPKSKVALVLTDLPGFSVTANTFGSLVLSTNTGAVAALGLRFGPEAFTSIPVVQFFNP